MEEALAISEEDKSRLLEKLLGVRHSAFFDKIDRVIKAWRFGARGLFFSDWCRYTKAIIQERLENNGKATT